MKSIRLHFKRQFDYQYTLNDLDNFPIQEFQAMIGLLNKYVYQRPLPGPNLLWTCSLILFFTAASILFYLLWLQFHQLYLIGILLPTFILLITLYLLCLYQYKRKKFEENILEICSQLNAVENIRGINFKFMKNNVDVTHVRIKKSLSTFINKVPTYAIIVEFDDRFIALKKQQRYSTSTTLAEYDDCNKVSKPEQAYLFDQKTELC
ncbi:uncharacterized protein BX663DRAFT_151154 [Cokeromyces recurvatus]|uniref:uncharacterized protein n=1 Tax=Cokeromyces recurvatus TaxID=90255 RepID=UPI00221E46C4|nr:uncharacterized protein BX663DRAFT_151154 [Cokeromyces recurvatus]KAI7900610.1 hypothetical protein BX663DRAFT_151154 [Cokeromyces recurvatus]